MPSVFCDKCGHQNPDDAMFCARCGNRLRRGSAGASAAADQTSTLALSGVDGDAEDEATAEILEELPAGFALLVVQRGPNAGSRFLLDQEVTTVGRHPDSDIFLDDVTVSRQHATFTRTPEGYRLQDAGSLNGTYLNRERIEAAGLGNGDEVQIGKFRLLFFASATGSRS
ncbi:MAG TPA: FHA domain-containing protein [Mycobacteriales bacterium]|nr:FHA domain-containing protein [Mycobacteriales bacterium]